MLLSLVGCKEDDPVALNPNITNLNPQIIGCPDGSELYSVQIDFDFEGVEETEEFTIGVAADKNLYGTYQFADLPVVIDSLLGDNWTELEMSLYVPKEDSVNNQVFPLEVAETVDCIGIVSHDRWTKVLEGNVSQAGNVNYPGILARFDDLRIYLNTLSGNPPESSWSLAEEKCYWINAYNAFTVNLILENYPLQSIMDLNDPWGTKQIPIGDEMYSLDSIEQHIIRPLFADSDPDTDDALFHYAVNCAATSCPPLLDRAYTAEALEQDLESQAFRFINTETYNYLEVDSVAVSQLFAWYLPDYTDQDTTGMDADDRAAIIVDYITQYAALNVASDAAVSYLEYDWTLND